MFLEILQNSEENACARVSLLKKRLWYRCFPVNFVKLQRTAFLQNISERLLLKIFKDSNDNNNICDKVFKNGLNKICRRQLCSEQTITYSVFYRLSSTNFTWSILEYFVSFDNAIIFRRTSKTLKGLRHGFIAMNVVLSLWTWLKVKIKIDFYIIKKTTHFQE